ncbi:hypothetical protein E2C01_085941 [Portunus trituberculatus]|uniref:Uncharacterized protein n=1 Tax=Portunus trituberculatus TaxID=210409 RepID=A0A5B7JC39_PORTR|nr:hypothetical protein [Portunus trituberculatus]
MWDNIDAQYLHHLGDSLPKGLKNVKKAREHPINFASLGCHRYHTFRSDQQCKTHKTNSPAVQAKLWRAMHLSGIDEWAHSDSILHAIPHHCLLFHCFLQGSQELVMHSFLYQHPVGTDADKSRF